MVRAPRYEALITGRYRVLTVLALVAIAGGGALHIAALPGAGDAVWATLVVVMLVPLSWSVARDVVRGRFGVDVIALIAMAGALALGEYLAGAVVALMLAGGNALEASASRRARRALARLLELAPTIAHVRRDGQIEEVPVDAIMVGDVVIVRSGEVVPVDGVVVSERALLDEATLTGEPLPVSRLRGEPLRSGTSNAGAPFDLRTRRRAADSSYAALVELVARSERERAPFVRLADRYAAILLPLTLLTAGAAWALSGDPVRALAVVVVATPCPLILAAPIAFVAGISRAASMGIIVKSGGAIEALGRVRSVLLDKTGTLTVGAPRVEAVHPSGDGGGDELLRLAASLEQLSPHVLAESIVHAAQDRGARLENPVEVHEEPGQGIDGRVGAHRVAVGSPAFVRRQMTSGSPAGLAAGDGTTVHVALDGAFAGAIAIGDALRPDATAMVCALREAGVRYVALVSGDRRSTAEAVGRAVGVDRVYAEQSPEDKLAVVRAVREDEERAPVAMVGDGVNDAPALAIADVGIAIAGEGSTVSAQTADVVIVVDRIERVAAAVQIGRRSLVIARQSVLVGMGLSVAAMAAAAAGLLAPVAGALLQEGIDVAVILNALRALRSG
ncbi:MAG TPA: heavy metal translocating P-type ATPase [Conexibacter sp.]|jgi:heavy metal translocating P-type ATPase|nr:heavy metal translocating P-type ATPase [Conexibacter sp.]